jgi:uncharacterized protein YdeI (YjbR/CyaY-like superfamily)
MPQQKPSLNPTFFPTPADWRAWLEANHDKATELLVGFYKKGSGRPSITWPESVDQALCFGWIDGVRRSIDEESYSIRFTPRKPTSNWSAVNIARVEELTKMGQMTPAGHRAFEKRADEKSGIYAYEQRHNAVLGEDFERQFRANPKAWEWFQSAPPSYRKTAIWWVISAKQEATRLKRLVTLIEDSAKGRNVPPFIRPGSKGK